MAVSGTGNLLSQAAASYTSKTSTASAIANNANMSIEDYWKLFAAELQNQDATEPMSNSDIMNQVTQMNSMETMNSLSEAVSNFAVVTNNLSQVTLTGYSTSMLGREVTVALTDEDGNYTGKLTGIVEGIDLTEDHAIYIDGKAYKLSQIMTVGKVPEATDEVVADSTVKTEENI